MHIAPCPSFAGVERPNDRMASRVKMRQRMRPRRILAAADMAARHADSKRHPVFAERHALLAATAGRIGIADYVEMFAAFVRHCEIQAVRNSISFVGAHGSNTRDFKWHVPLTLLAAFTRLEAGVGIEPASTALQAAA